MKVWLSRQGLYVWLREPTDDRRAQGFIIKPASQMIFSERYGGYKRALRLGPLYFRTYARKVIRH